MNRNKRQSLTIETKLRILQTVDENDKKPALQQRKRSDIASEFNIKPSSLSCIVKTRESIEARTYSSDFTSAIKRFRHANKFPEVDEALLKWFKGCRASNNSINDELLLTKARFFIGVQSVSGDISMSWLQRWKSRHGIVSKRICGESASVTHEITSNWYTDVLPSILQRYPARDIFNCDETALFWKLAPTTTLAFKDEKCHGGKHAKDRVSIVVGASMIGEKLPLLVIGKSAHPRAFRNKRVPLDYTHNSKAWMTGYIFQEYVRKIDKRMASNSRHIALIVDNCPSHVRVNNLHFVTLIFLPPNTTSKTQPMDCGVIWSLKAHYRKQLMAKHLIAHDANMTFKSNLLLSLNWLQCSWESVTEETIANCFIKAGFVVQTEDSTVPVASSPNEIPSDIGSIFERFRTVFGIDSDAALTSFISIDDDVITSENISESEIIRHLSASTDAANIDSEDSDCTDDQFEPLIPSPAEALDMLEKIRLCLLAHSSSESDFRYANFLQASLTQIALNNKRQLTLDNFLVKYNE